MLIRKLFALIASFLGLGVDPPADQTPDPAPPASNAGGSDGAEPPVDDGELPDLDAPDDPDDGATDPPDHGAMLRSATERAERAEREAREEREARQALERSRGQPQQTDEQRLFEQEEAILNNPQSTEQQRYWAQANRTLRENRRMAQDALWQSREASDRAAFEKLLTSRPVAKKYEKRVEEKLTEIRKGGHNLERKLVLAMLIGTDIVDGKVTTKRPKPADGADPARQRVDRGTPPRQRGDVRARAGASEQSKRAARLENQII